MSQRVKRKFFIGLAIGASLGFIIMVLATFNGT